jgi:hypothetical protein
MNIHSMKFFSKIIIVMILGIFVSLPVFIPYSVHAQATGAGGFGNGGGVSGAGGVDNGGGVSGAGGVPDPNAGKGGVYTISNPLSSKFNSVGTLLEGFVEIFSYLAVLFAVLMLIYVGFRFVLAQGEPAEMNKLKDWLLWIVVGVAIVIGARVIVSVVINTLQKTGTVNPSVITNAQNAIQGH